MKSLNECEEVERWNSERDGGKRRRGRGDKKYLGKRSSGKQVSVDSLRQPSTISSAVTTILEHEDQPHTRLVNNMCRGLSETYLDGC